MDSRNITLARQGSAPTISRRAYNALTFGMVTVSFLVVWGMYGFAATPAFARLLLGGSGLAVLVGSLVGSIVGIVLMSMGKSRESVPLSLVGYVLFSLTFGLSMALGLEAYDVGTIYHAFGITACLSGIFLILGVMYPSFFASIGRMLTAALLALIVVELVASLLFHVDQSVFDYIVVALFCGFLGFDSYMMAADEPTVPNAIWYAADIYLDIANILIRVLSIMDRD